MTPPTQHDLILAEAVREAAATMAEDTIVAIYEGVDEYGYKAADAIRNMDLSALLAAHGNPNPSDAKDVQRSATALEVLKKFVEWNRKYPSSRIFSYGEMATITKQLDAINDEAISAIAAAHIHPTAADDELGTFCGECRNWDGKHDDDCSKNPWGAHDVQRSATVGPCESTPSSRWKAEGQPDPHGDRYDCSREALALGWLTDDELANAAFMNYDVRPSFEDLIAGKAFMPIVYMTAVKERIRWLSRKLDEANSHGQAVESAPTATANEGLQRVRLTDEQIWEIYQNVQQALNGNGLSGKEFAIALVRAVLSQPAAQKGETA